MPRSMGLAARCTSANPPPGEWPFFGSLGMGDAVSTMCLPSPCIIVPGLLGRHRPEELAPPLPRPLSNFLDRQGDGVISSSQANLQNLGALNSNGYQPGDPASLRPRMAPSSVTI